MTTPEIFKTDWGSSEAMYIVHITTLSPILFKNKGKIGHKSKTCTYIGTFFFNKNV